MDVEDPLSLDQVASVVGVHYQTVYRWVRSGHLQATKIHGKYFVQQSDLVELQERSSKPAPPPPAVKSTPETAQRCDDQSPSRG